MGKVIMKFVIAMGLSVVIFIYTLSISRPSNRANIIVETIPILDRDVSMQYDTINFENNDEDYIKSLSLIGCVNDIRNIVLINKDSQKVFCSLIDVTMIKDFNSGISEGNNLHIVLDTLQYVGTSGDDISPYILKSEIIVGKRYVFHIMPNTADDSVIAFNNEQLYLKGLADYRLVGIDIWG